METTGLDYNICDNIWQYLTIFNIIWKYLTICSIIRQYLAIFDNIRQFLKIRQYSTLFNNSTIFDIIRRSSTFFDCQIMLKNVAVHNFCCLIMSRTLKKVGVHYGGTFIYTFYCNYNFILICIYYSEFSILLFRRGEAYHIEHLDCFVV